MGYQNDPELRHLVIVVTAKMTAETFVMKFATYIAQKGYRVTVIADGLNKEKVIVDNGVLEQVPVQMEREPAPLRDFKSLRNLIATLRDLQPDILIYATPKASLLTSIAGLYLKIPERIYQIWGLRLETTSGLKKFVLKIMEKMTSLGSTKILANSRSLANRYQELNLNLGKEINVVGKGSSHGVDLEFFANDRPTPGLNTEVSDFLAKTQGMIKLGFVGRLHPDKGISTLVEAAEICAINGLKISLIFVGGDEGAGIKLPEHPNLSYITVGHTSDVRPYYSIMDILVLPSLREGFPNVVLEAAAMGVPAIVSDGTGVVDSVVDCETGLIFPVGNSLALAEAIQELAKDPQLLKKMGSMGRKWVESYYSQENVWIKTLEYYLK
ncbi:glycosyltransferase family 4 protein [Corynebacterium callunae]|uniref:Group 1 glycosyl transferase n=1 Tax=Corynebacterium callunae DSM 20147 TaxID=1121353 RepID=M1URT3_9CORY|nr:glycosyltransferase family 4 protein [Corynebacterium callunae]AGG65767.1 group 1 glycosyl transferase [Corynebacterium callunae DSM 20147]